MTEDEAKTKWCPFVRLIDCRDGMASLRCIASDCMAWRATDNEGRPTPPEGGEIVFLPAGYCGLAGKL